MVSSAATSRPSGQREPSSPSTGSSSTHSSVPSGASLPSHERSNVPPSPSHMKPALPATCTLPSEPIARYEPETSGRRSFHRTSPAGGGSTPVSLLPALDSSSDPDPDASPPSSLSDCDLGSHASASNDNASTLRGGQLPTTMSMSIESRGAIESVT